MTADRIAVWLGPIKTVVKRTEIYARNTDNFCMKIALQSLKFSYVKAQMTLKNLDLNHVSNESQKTTTQHTRGY